MRNSAGVGTAVIGGTAHGTGAGAGASAWGRCEGRQLTSAAAARGSATAPAAQPRGAAVFVQASAPERKFVSRRYHATRGELNTQARIASNSAGIEPGLCMDGEGLPFWGLLRHFGDRSEALLAL